MSQPAVHDYALATGLSRASDDASSPEPSTLDMQFAGALTFAPDGTLFVGDNHRGAVHAFEIPAGSRSAAVTATSIRNIDAKIAELLGVGATAVEINDLAVHPLSDELFISVMRIGSFASQPALVRVSTDQRLDLVDLPSLPFTSQDLGAFPSSDTMFQVRGTGSSGAMPRDIAKGGVTLRSLAIMDMEFHEDELYVAGVAHDNFRSTLRRIAYPFDGRQGVTSVEMYHIAHDRFESRAPIRAMSVQHVDGRPQLVAAYTCSPIVLVPLEEIRDGATITARTIIDMGNGQPLDMVPFQLRGRPMLFVTSNSRTPRVIPVDDLSGARAVTADDLERGPKLDLHPLMPFGPAGKAVMFEGVPLHVARVGEHHFVAITRDAYTGDLNLDVNPAAFPNRMHHFVAEMDFPQ